KLAMAARTHPWQTEWLFLLPRYDRPLTVLTTSLQRSPLTSSSKFSYTFSILKPKSTSNSSSTSHHGLGRNRPNADDPEPTTDLTHRCWARVAQQPTRHAGHVSTPGAMPRQCPCCKELRNAQSSV
ncbi:hypothetical protein HAX54_017674, partial [Datura stramonium]|nr:hypothetical protein [Datura stramonium]